VESRNREELANASSAKSHHKIKNRAPQTHPKKKASVSISELSQRVLSVHLEEGKTKKDWLARTQSKLIRGGSSQEGESAAVLVEGKSEHSEKTG